MCGNMKKAKANITFHFPIISLKLNVFPLYYVFRFKIFFQTLDVLQYFQLFLHLHVAS